LSIKALENTDKVFRGCDRILAFVADLHRRFDPEWRRLLAMRLERQVRYDCGELPKFSGRDTGHPR
jgi:malate synthase